MFGRFLYGDGQEKRSATSAAFRQGAADRLWLWRIQRREAISSATFMTFAGGRPASNSDFMNSM